MVHLLQLADRRSLHRVVKRKRRQKWDEAALKTSRKRSRERSDDEILQELIDECPALFSSRELEALKAGADALRKLEHPER